MSCTARGPRRGPFIRAASGHPRRPPLSDWLHAFNSGDRAALRQFLSANAAPSTLRLLMPSLETTEIRERTGGFDVRCVEIDRTSGYVIAVLSNLDPFAAQHVSGFVTARLPGGGEKQ